MVRALVKRPQLEHVAWFAALICGVAPLWSARALPMVDLPQHLHLISVLHRLDDTTTLFPEVFARRPVLTPYLGYYYAVSALNWLMPLELANTVFLTLYVAGLPLSLAFLLASLKRPTWPALLAIPFAFGDSFGWGFVNYCSALPLAFLTCGFFVRALEATDAVRRRNHAIALALSLIAVLLFHVQVFAFLGVALPMLLLMTAAGSGPRDWRARVPAVLGVTPGVALFVAWVGFRAGQPAEIAPGQPWKSWGPMLSAQNLSWKTFQQNRDEFLPTLANLVPDGSDQLAVKVAFALAALALVGGLVLQRRPAGDVTLREGPVARFRIAGLALIALILFFALPFDIRGYMYYLNTRYAHLAAALLVCCVPVVAPGWSKRLVWGGALVGLLTAVPLVKAFRAFDEDQRALEALASGARPKARVMGLVFNPMSRASTHPVFLHASTVIARLEGGLTNFSFALTPHSPLMYRQEPPPTFASEWRPDQMQWETQGRFYDHFVVRGVHPRQIFGPLLESQQLEIAAQSGDWFLVRTR